jgi:hypothetical protein
MSTQDTASPSAAPGGESLSPLAAAARSSGQDSGGGPGNMGEGESALTRPLSTYFGIPEYRQGAGGIERAAEKFASGLTSPLNIGLMLVTGGLGGIAEAGASTAAAEAGEAVTEGGLSVAGRAGASLLSRLSPDVAAKVATASGTIEKLANFGFTANQIIDVTKAVPRIGDAIKAGDTDTAAEMITSAALGTVAAGLSAAHLLRGTPDSPVVEHDKEIIGIAQQQERSFNQRAEQFEHDHLDLIKDKPTDMAAMLYHEAGGKLGEAAPVGPFGPNAPPRLTTTDQLKAWHDDVLADKNIQPQIRQRWADLLDKAQKLPDEVKNLSSGLADRYREFWEDYKDRKIVREALPGGASNEGRENYAGPHIYDPQDGMNSGLLDRSRRMVGTPQHLKAREFPTAVDALKAGLEPTRGLAAAHAEYIRQVGQKMAHFEAEKALLAERVQDGMPMAVSPATIRGVKEVIPDPNGGTGLMPGKTRTAVSADAAGVDLNKVPPERLFQGQDGKLYLDVHDYKDGPDTFTRRRWLADARDPNDSTKSIPITEAKPLLIHPKYVEPVKTAFGEDSSWLRKNSILGPLLKLSSTAKTSLLNPLLSPFHWTTEYLRGLQMGLGPMEAFRPPRLAADSAAVTKKFGPTILGGSTKAGLEFSEGLGGGGGLLSKVPVFGKAMENIEQKLFGANGYIDRLKGAAFEKVSKQLGERNKNWSPDQVDFAASKIVDAAFGGLNWKMLGTSMNTRDALRLFLLAPDFTGSQVAFAKYGFQPGGSVIAQSLGRIALYNFAAAQALNLLVNGKIHPEHPFAVVSPDGKNVMSVRTMPQDIFHAMTDPRGFIYNRLNPLTMRTGAEYLQGRDEQGKQVTAEKQVHDLLRNVLPISSQNFVPTFRREGEGIGTGVARSLGVNVEPDTTTAYKTASKLASSNSESGPVDTAKLNRHQYVMQLEDDLRSGKLKGPDINQKVHDEELTQDEAKQIYDNFKATSKGGAEGKPMSDWDARLYTRSNRLPVKELLQVYDVATPQEKKLLLPILQEKGKAYVKKALTSMIKKDREADPTYNRLLRDLSPHMPLW